MKQIKELDAEGIFQPCWNVINEKLKQDILLFNTLEGCIERTEKLEETKSDKI